MAPRSPVVAAIDLGLRIKDRREQLDLSGSEMGKAAGISVQFFSNVENGQKILVKEKLELVADRLELDRDERAELLALRDRAAETSPFSAYRSVLDPRVRRFFDIEWGADTLHAYNGTLIHGLLQDEAYGTAVIGAGRTYFPQTQVRRRWLARHKRQERLRGDDPVRLRLVMHEAALRSMPGGPKVQAAALTNVARQIEELSETLDVVIAPLDSATASTGAAAYELMFFDEGRVPTFLWSEGGVLATQLTGAEEAVDTFALTWKATYEDPRVLSREDSLALIVQIAKELR